MTTNSRWDTTSLLTDRYELTMLQAALCDGTAERSSVFELFARRLPDGRRYGVVAGIGRMLDALDDFRFDERALDYLRREEIVDETTINWLADFRFTGDIWGYPEGEVYFPGSPVLIVEGSFAQCIVLETLLLSVLNHDAAIASAAARMVTAAAGRPCIEMGSRRTHEAAAVACARAAYIAGFAATSNLQAGDAYEIPTTGTSAHSFTLLHDTERDAFAAQIAALGKDTTLLVDTYDVREAVRIAVELAGPELGGVRLDSGDLVSLATSVRAQLDELGATRTRVIVTSDLDEYAIASLAAAPVDGYGVGTALVTGSGFPTCGFVYKLVARAAQDGTMVPVAKKSKDKISMGGRKYVLRQIAENGRAQAELVGIGELPANDGNDRAILVPLVTAGRRVCTESLQDARTRLRSSLAELPASATRLSRGEPVIDTIFKDSL